MTRSVSLRRFCLKRAQSIKNAKRRGTAASAASALVAVTFADRAITLVPADLFVQASAVATTPLRVPVDNDADTLDIACDGATAVVVGANSATPVALVDLAAQRQLATLAYPGKLARSVSVDADGSQALVMLHANAMSAGGAIRRLVIAGEGLTDNGKELTFGQDYVARVYLAPGGRSGVAVVGGGSTRLVAFALPSLTVTGSVNLGAVGNAVVFGPDGTRVFVRSGQRGARDAISAFPFDAAAGAIGTSSLWRSEIVSGFTGTVYETSLAIAPDGSVLIAGDENIGGATSCQGSPYSTRPRAHCCVRSTSQPARPHESSPRIVPARRLLSRKPPSSTTTLASTTTSSPRSPTRLRSWTTARSPAGRVPASNSTCSALECPARRIPAASSARALRPRARTSARPTPPSARP